MTLMTLCLNCCYIFCFYFCCCFNNPFIIVVTYIQISIDQTTNRLDSVSHGEVCHSVDNIFKTMKCNGTSPSRNDESIDNRTSKVSEQCTYADHSRSIDVKGIAEPDNLDSVRNVKSDTKPESAWKKRGR